MAKKTALNWQFDDGAESLEEAVVQNWWDNVWGDGHRARPYERQSMRTTAVILVADCRAKIRYSVEQRQRQGQNRSLKLKFSRVALRRGMSVKGLGKVTLLGLGKSQDSYRSSTLDSFLREQD